MAEKMTRRTFMKSAATAAAAISLSGVLVGCGGGSAATDEVKLGAYTVKLYSANTHADVQGTGASSYKICLLYTSPSPRDGLLSRMPSSA